MMITSVKQQHHQQLSQFSDVLLPITIGFIIFDALALLNLKNLLLHFVF